MALFDDLFPISKKELKEVCRVLGDAFSKDPIMNAVNLEGEEINTMYEIFIRCCLRYGSVYATSEKLEGIIAITLGKNAIMTMWNVIRSGAILPALKLRKKFSKEMQESLKLMDEEKKNVNLGSYIYLAVLGVSQENQGKGFGGKMLSALIEKAEDEGKSLYLETETEENVRLYKRFGFEVLKEIFIPEMDLPLWTMVRNSTIV